MRAYYPDGSTTDVSNAYAYSVAPTLVHVLRQCGDDLTRANIMRQAANVKDPSLPMLLPGIKINTSPNDFLPDRAGTTGPLRRRAVGALRRTVRRQQPPARPAFKIALKEDWGVRDITLLTSPHLPPMLPS